MGSAAFAANWRMIALTSQYSREEPSSETLAAGRFEAIFSRNRKAQPRGLGLLPCCRLLDYGVTDWMEWLPCGTDASAVGAEPVGNGVASVGFRLPVSGLS